MGEIEKFLNKRDKIKSTTSLEIPKNILKELYINQRKSAKSIAKLLNCGATTISRYLDKYNLVRVALKPKINIDKNTLYKLYIVDNMSTREIGKLYNCNNNVISQKLQKYSIPKKSVKDQYEHLSQAKTIDIPKESLEKIFIKHNNSIRDTARILGVSHTVIDKLLKKYNLHKSPEQIKECISKKTLQNHGVPFYVMTEDCYKKATENKISKPNLQWQNIIKSWGYRVFLEKKIGKYYYDLSIPALKIVLEINPITTHNSTLNVFNRTLKGKQKEYHLTKTKNANLYGYSCIHIWDWDNTNSIKYLLKWYENPDKNSFYNHYYSYIEDEIYSFDYSKHNPNFLEKLGWRIIWIADIKAHSNLYENQIIETYDCGKLYATKDAFELEQEILKHGGFREYVY